MFRIWQNKLKILCSRDVGEQAAAIKNKWCRTWWTSSYSVRRGCMKRVVRVTWRICSVPISLRTVVSKPEIKRKRLHSGQFWAYTLKTFPNFKVVSKYALWALRRTFAMRTLEHSYVCANSGVSKMLTRTRQTYLLNYLVPSLEDTVLRNALVDIFNWRKTEKGHQEIMRTE